MTVRVQASGSLRTYAPAGTTMEDAQTVGDAIERLHLPASAGLAILVNGHIAHWGTPLSDGDLVQLVPQLSGG